MKELITAFKILFVMTVLTGIIYPTIIWSYSNFFVKDKANGSLLTKTNVIIGSELLGQKFTKQQYFWSRPSTIEYNPTSSGASNQGPTSADLKKQVEARRAVLSVDLSADLSLDHEGEIPQDLLFASASGLDPHISVESANFQIARIAKHRGLEDTTVRNLIQELTEKPQYGIFGEARVNVLKLNLKLDEFLK